MKKVLFTIVSVSLLMIMGCNSSTEQLPSALLGEGPRGSEDFKIGVAGFTYREFNLDQTLELLNRIDVHYLSIKDWWLPFNSTAEQMDSLKAKCAAANVNPYILGPIYMNSEEDVNKTFDYVERFGQKMFIGVPSYEIIDYVIAKVKETGIKVAIHTHGPDNAPFPNISKVVEMVKDSTLGVGCCMDLGHSVRLGDDIIKDIYQYKNWIYDIHMKDETAACKDGHTYEMGRGVMNYASIIKALRDINYKGCISLEFEGQGNNPTPSVAESIGYFKGVADATK